MNKEAIDKHIVDVFIPMVKNFFGREPTDKEIHVHRFCCEKGLVDFNKDVIKSEKEQVFEARVCLPVKNSGGFIVFKDNVIINTFMVKLDGQIIKVKKINLMLYEYQCENGYYWKKEWLKNIRPIDKKHEFIDGEWYLCEGYVYNYKHGIWWNVQGMNVSMPDDAIVTYITPEMKKINHDKDIDWLRVPRDTEVKTLGSLYYFSDYLSESAIPFQLYSSHNKRNEAHAVNNFHHCQLVNPSDIKEYLKDDVKWKAQFLGEEG